MLARATLAVCFTLLVLPSAAALEPLETPAPVGTPAYDAGRIVVTTPALPGVELVVPALVVPAHGTDATHCIPTPMGGLACLATRESEARTVYGGGTWARHEGFASQDFTIGGPKGPALVLVPEGTKVGVGADPATCVVLGPEGARATPCAFDAYVLPGGPLRATTPGTPAPPAAGLDGDPASCLVLEDAVPQPRRCDLRVLGLPGGPLPVKLFRDA